MTTPSQLCLFAWFVCAIVASLVWWRFSIPRMWWWYRRLCREPHNMPQLSFLCPALFMLGSDLSPYLYNCPHFAWISWIVPVTLQLRSWSSRHKPGSWKRHLQVPLKISSSRMYFKPPVWQHNDSWGHRFGLLIDLHNRDLVVSWNEGLSDRWKISLLYFALFCFESFPVVPLFERKTVPRIPSSFNQAVSREMWAELHIRTCSLPPSFAWSKVRTRREHTLSLQFNDLRSSLELSGFIFVSPLPCFVLFPCNPRSVWNRSRHHIHAQKELTE